MTQSSDTFAMLIVGAVTAGKSTLARSLNDRTGIEVISEETTGDFQKISREIDSSLHPVAIFEHTSIYGEWRKFREQYDHIMIVFLYVDEAMLQRNYDGRIQAGDQGEYLNVDPIKEQQQIADELAGMGIPFDDETFRLIRVGVHSVEDYEAAVDLLERELNEAGIAGEVEVTVPLEKRG